MTGSYLVKFSVPSTFADNQLRLRFEGVDAAFHLWLNGKEIGYSQGSRNPSEFDITSHVKDGENTLAVRVYQWCDGTYIEDQGEFISVLLSSRNSKVCDRSVVALGNLQRRIPLSLSQRAHQRLPHPDLN